MDPLTGIEIATQFMVRFWPTWLALIVLFALSFYYKPRLGLYGHLFDTWVGIVGVGLVMFWIFTALFADAIALFEPLDQLRSMKKAPPGTIEPKSQLPYLFGGDNLARDIFSRMVHGSRIVLAIAPAATLIAFIVGAALGLPAGYYGGKVDSVLTFIANLVLAFPVIVLFYLLVTPGIRDTAVPYMMAAVLFIIPILFFVMMWWTRFRPRPHKLALYLGLTVLIGGWLYSGLVFDADPLGIVHLEPNELNIFVAVAFVSSSNVFRIVRSLTLDIKTRDYVAAAQTRGEPSWYVMLWEILPNARGPLIVDACLRIGYVTILLGTLGFFGLGLPPESPDWGTMINEARAYMRVLPTGVLPPTIALMLMVLGLNLLADALREQSLKD